MEKELHIDLMDLVSGVSDAIDLISPLLVNHHSRVAYGAYAIAHDLGLPNRHVNEIALAAILHDIGAFSCMERLDLLRFEV